MEPKSLVITEFVPFVVKPESLLIKELVVEPELLLGVS